MNNKPTLTLMCGFPRSGKSTWIQKHTGTSLVVEPDWIRINILGHHFHKPAEPIIWLIADSLIRISLDQGHNVILDGINIKTFIREKYITLAKSLNCFVDCVWIQTSEEECLRRNSESEENQKLPEEVLIMKFKQFDPPTMDEGFDRILTPTTEKDNTHVDCS